MSLSFHVSKFAMKSREERATASALLWGTVTSHSGTEEALSVPQAAGTFLQQGLFCWGSNKMALAAGPQTVTLLSPAARAPADTEILKSSAATGDTYLTSANSLL